MEPLKNHPIPSHQELAVLYAYRVLVKGGGQKRFVSGRGFRDEELSLFLGLQEYPDERFDRDQAIKALRKRLREAEVGLSGRSKQSPLRNIERLGRLIGLSQDEKRILGFAVSCELYSELRDAIGYVLPDFRGKLQQLIALALDMDPRSVDVALNANSPLSRAGLIKTGVSSTIFVDTLQFNVLPGLAAALVDEFHTLDAVFETLFRRTEPTHLDVRAFPHIREDVSRLRRLLTAAREQRAPGVNVLIYGAPGVGKTELVKTLARSLRCSLYEIAYSDKDGDPATGQTRFRSFQLCQQLLRRRTRTLIMFDEIEDVFAHAPLGAPSEANTRIGKAWINRQLENNPVPTVWLTNSVDCIDPAHLRRFDYVLELGTPPRSVRRRMIDRACRDLPLSNAWREEMSQNSALTPALIEQATRVARLTAADQPKEAEAVARETVARQLKLQGIRPPKNLASNPWLPYGLDFLNSNQDLNAVVDGIARTRRGSLLLYGPPGTGKTAFAHHLAEQLERPLSALPASRILGKWLGETEQNIARMFEDAREDDAVLLLDEADSLLRSRAHAEHSWQVTQVNELLVQIEAFEGVFLCATNFLEITDDAALRRFDLKLRLGYPDEPQRLRLFEALCDRVGIRLTLEDRATAQESLAPLPNLAPGDFATIARRSQVLKPNDATELLQQLREESRLKPDGQRRTIGFV